jgi:hypothetical protein
MNLHLSHVHAPRLSPYFLLTDNDNLPDQPADLSQRK